MAQVEKEAENETAETGAGVNALHFDPEDGMLWPMEGNVILNYSMDSTIYFATLDQYKYNPAVIIAGRSTIRYIPSQREKSSVSPTTRRLAVR